MKDVDTIKEENGTTSLKTTVHCNNPRDGSRFSFPHPLKGHDASALVAIASAQLSMAAMWRATSRRPVGSLRSNHLVDRTRMCSIHTWAGFMSAARSSSMYSFEILMWKIFTYSPAV